MFTGVVHSLKESIYKWFVYYVNNVNKNIYMNNTNKEYIAYMYIPKLYNAQ
ncbi:hypothetical protein EAL2_c19900 [Peptoclostridium acidaminophilum DSM 3953]|uniref:Uncharacterized protein n=1 Tax=Peptoclostridium acidaminophilum DSM 3953 TaxID=1286171 RepID=W8U8U0_PEPAC|nr:hypothetical protein EAL2_c19900 [Peptoclostridium acidaminophilum DSM 3953]